MVGIAAAAVLHAVVLVLCRLLDTVIAEEEDEDDEEEEGEEAEEQAAEQEAAAADAGEDAADAEVTAGAGRALFAAMMTPGAEAGIQVRRQCSRPHNTHMICTYAVPCPGICQAREQATTAGHCSQASICVRLYTDCVAGVTVLG